MCSVFIQIDTDKRIRGRKRMSNTNDGGPAFPTDAEREAHALGLRRPLCGVSVCDYFAAQFLTTMQMGAHPHIIAVICYEMADAMLTERAK